MTNSKSTSHSEWTDCQGGEISGLVQKLQNQRAVSRRTQITQSLTIAVGLLVAVGLGTLMLPSGEPNYGGIVCTDVIKNGEGYVLHKLEPELADRIKVHIDQCEYCQGKFAMLRKKLGIKPSKIDKQQQDDQADISLTTTIAALLLRQ
ncbi:MAG: hypothetical protein JKY95_12165 [Planctomycetaceae bacterium]|nr:hypothetical protein [Planctomycetaceae bacterium]